MRLMRKSVTGGLLAVVGGVVVLGFVVREVVVVVVMILLRSSADAPSCDSLAGVGGSGLFAFTGKRSACLEWTEESRGAEFGGEGFESCAESAKQTCVC